MFKNNFDEVFERVYGAPEFSRYTRQRRVSVVVKWAAYIGVLALIIFITRLFGIELTDLKITFLCCFGWFWLPCIGLSFVNSAPISCRTRCFIRFCRACWTAALMKKSLRAAALLTERNMKRVLRMNVTETFPRRIFIRPNLRLR